MPEMTAKRRRLLDLSIKETSGVDHAANNTQMGGAEGWLVMKAAKARSCPECSSPLLAGVDRCPEGHTVKADKEAPDMTKPTGRAAQLVKAAQAVADARAAVEANPADAEAIKALETALADVVADPEAGGAGDAGGDSSDVTALNARIAELETQLATDAGDGEGADEAAELAKAMKDMPEPVRRALEKAQADAAKAAADATAASEAAKVERSARLDAEFVTKAKAYGNVAKADELGPVLRAISEGAPTALPVVERILSAYEAQAEAGELFKSVGKSGHGGGGDTRMATVRQKAEEFRLARAAAGEQLTPEQAISQVLALNPSLAEHKEN